MQTKDLAIQATLKGNWEEAITLNLEILKDSPKDTEALNRLAFAYAVQGKLKEAKEMYGKVLKIDYLNPIAQKNLKRLGESSPKKATPIASYHIDNNMFLEEVGKTKVITLLNTAPPKVLRTLRVGQPLQLTLKRLKIFALDESKEFIGMLPDNVSRRLTKFMKGGNKYEAYVKSVEDHIVMLFVKETKRSARYKNLPSFAMLEASATLSLSKKKVQEDLDEDTVEE